MDGGKFSLVGFWRWGGESERESTVVGVPEAVWHRRGVLGPEEE